MWYGHTQQARGLTDQMKRDQKKKDQESLDKWLQWLQVRSNFPILDEELCGLITLFPSSGMLVCVLTTELQ